MADPYTLLGVPRTADEAAIKSAYRKLAKELHPDKNKDNPKASERFSEVTHAYDLLSDKDKRAQFDRGEIDGNGNPTSPFGGGGYRQGPGGFESGGGGDFGDIFEGLFGGGRRAGGGGGGFGGFGGGRAQPPRQGDNVQYRLRVPFVDAATRAPQRITLQDGKTIDLKLPAGVEHGMQMRLSGKGERGPGGAGDAIVIIDIDAHAFFKRDGDDVRVDVPITLDEAVNGARIKVPTVDGPVMLAVPAGARSGQTLRLKERGFTRKDGARGAQYVTLLIDIPADDEHLKAFVADWTDTRAVRGDLGV
ncbi:MAG TPA: DnaJ C-terminal domain-containing protein [Sphingobium sp.]